ILQGSDTAKIILREFEAFDKQGNRGSGFDTIIVYRLPAIEAEEGLVQNVYCAEKDSIYCGYVAPDDCVGPFMIVPERNPLTGDIDGDFDGDGEICDTICLVNVRNGPDGLIFEPVQLDPKC